MIGSLNKFLFIQRAVIKLRLVYLTRIWGMSLHPTVRLSMSAKLDKTYPRGVHIGEESYITFDAAILCHDMTRGVYRDTYVGRHCFIGARSIVMPGVRVGDGSIVAAGSIVTQDVPPRSIVAGNPAVVIRSDIEVGPYGRFLNAGKDYAPKPRPKLESVGVAVD